MNNIVGSFFPGFANHVWQSTAFAVAAWLLTILLRRNPARVRYGIWLAASIKFLIPFSLLVAMGDLVPKPKPLIAPAMYTAMHVAAQPLAGNTWTPAPSVLHEARMWRRVAANIPIALIVLWLVGATTVFFLWGIHWRRLSLCLHNPTPITPGRELEILRRLEGRLSSYLPLPLCLRLSTEQVEPRIHGMLRPVLVWPEQLSGRLSDEHIEVIMTHELVHARRFDNLTAALHMLVEAVFWFHPLVWWMERRLIEECEHACDEAVVELGGNPDVYAESLLTTCRFCVESALLCAAGVTGAELTKRVVDIMTTRKLMRMTWPKTLLVLAPAMCMIAAPVFLGQAKSAGSKLPEFEVASIRPSSTTQREMNGFYTYPGGRVVGKGCWVQYLLMEAFNMRAFQINGGPYWITKERYDIEAKPPASSASAHSHPAFFKSPPNDEQRQMLQSLLIDRFHLKFHRETTEGPIYILERTNKPLKLRDAKDKTALSWAGSPEGGAVANGTGLAGINISMAQLAIRLAGFVGRPVVDQTGLQGSFDFEYKTGEYDRDADEAATITTSLRHFGLELRGSKGRIDAIAIDQIEKPSAN